MIMFVIMLPVLIFFIAIMISCGHLVSARTEAQAAVDAAALASVAALPRYHATGSLTDVYTLAGEFNGGDTSTTRNAVAQANPNIQSTDLQFFKWQAGTLTPLLQQGQTNAIKVTKTYTVPTFLQAVTSRASWTVNVSATALLGSPGCMIPRIPVAFIDCSLSQPVTGLCSSTSCGTTITLAFSNPGQSQAAIFYTIGGQPSSANICRQMAQGGVVLPTMCLSSEITINNGSLTSCLDDIENQCNSVGCNLANPWMVEVPIINCEALAPSGPASQTVYPAGFIRIGIISVSSHSNPKTITFKPTCATVATNGSPGGKNCGLYAPSPILVE